MSQNLDYFNFVIYPDYFNRYDLINPSYDYDIKQFLQNKNGLIILFTTPKLPDFKEEYGLTGAVITGVDLLKGLGVFANLDVIDVPGATGFFDTDYNAKGEYAVEALKNHDVLFIHIESPDEAGHAQLIDEKIKAIERIDEFIVGPVIDSLEGEDFKAAILPDHPTPISIGTHTRDDVPLVVYASGKSGDECTSFDEEGVKSGSIEKQDGYKLMSRLINEF